MRLRVLLLAAAVGLPMPMLADTGYSYTGNDFTTTQAGIFGPLYTTSDSVTGWFSVSTALGDNFSGTVTPSSYSFTDDVNVWDPTDSAVYAFDVTTDASGDITNWTINVGYPYIELAGIISDGALGDSGGDFIGGYAFNDTPGTWSGPYYVPAATPEPGSLMLLGTGLLCFVGTVRRRIARS